MSLTYGFFNSNNGDRKYNAEQMSSIFDGIIVDGVFASIGTAFAVKAAGGNKVNVGVGKAWFDHTWTLNDEVLTLEAPDPDKVFPRIDAVVLEVNHSDSVRANSIKFIQGVASSSPVRPTLLKEGTVRQYPLCYIDRSGGSTIAQANITNMIGTAETPFVTGILKTVSLDELLGQWQDELDRFVAKETAEFDAWSDSEKTRFEVWRATEQNTFAEWKSDEESKFETWSGDLRTDYESWIATNREEFTQWLQTQKDEYNAWFELMKADLTAEQKLLDDWVASEQADFLSWYNKMKGQLSEDAAGNLQLQIDKDEVKRILLVGFVDGSKEISEDGTVVTSIASDGRKLTKTFTDEFKTMTNVLRSTTGVEIARMVKTYDSTGLLMDTVVTYS